MNKDYRFSMNDWCCDCTGKPEPNKRCRECMVLDTTAINGKDAFGLPSEFVSKVSDDD